MDKPVFLHSSIVHDDQKGGDRSLMNGWINKVWYIYIQRNIIRSLEGM